MVVLQEEIILPSGGGPNDPRRAEILVVIKRSGRGL
jgi:hypothetical protein